MKLYRGNRIDGEWEISAEEIARRFWATHSADLGMQLDRALRGFIGATDGLNSVWAEDDETSYWEVFDATLAAWPKDDA